MAAVGRASSGASFAPGNTSSGGGDVQTRVEEMGSEKNESDVVLGGKRSDESRRQARSPTLGKQRAWRLSAQERGRGVVETQLQDNVVSAEGFASSEESSAHAFIMFW